MRIIYPTPTILGEEAYYENGGMAYSWYFNFVHCYNEKGKCTHGFKIKQP